MGPCQPLRSRRQRPQPEQRFDPARRRRPARRRHRHERHRRRRADRRQLTNPGPTTSRPTSGRPSPGRRRPPSAGRDATDQLADLIRHFRAAFGSDPVSAFRDWFRAQEGLADSGDVASCRALADDLWQTLPALRFDSQEKRARFFHNVAVFFGTPGPAADLSRAREAFGIALAHFSEHDEAGWRARALHNLATALSNLGQSPAELAESVALFEQALTWRTADRAIARGVTLHNMGIVLRREAELEPEGAAAHLEASAQALREAAAIRESHGLAEGHALSLFHLGLTLEADHRKDEARSCLAGAAAEFERLGKMESAAIARQRMTLAS